MATHPMPDAAGSGRGSSSDGFPQRGRPKVEYDSVQLFIPYFKVDRIMRY